ncbi:CDP-alcohol phosphatidyltransferase family protein [Shouchella miscanthi]|uniref:CDP-alcohol phosphatidyltransferase family protein n=1 Tax=Shouchella miscanthi TaxID=2598861 RepID=A0ABU6NS01_9BACI|nr:CDP-alcohol phosphatidyltransferase family protein [Shouchella miscanthi]MED4130208.1 CDP-alcohol phosphatidyltransferase family protein [Shouchella miscanthi]
MKDKQIASTWFDTVEIKRLRERSQAYSTKEDLWSWFVLRRISIFVTVIFLKLRLTPNTISWLSAFFVVFSGFWLIQATPFAFILAFFSYNFGYLFDCVDGEVARLTGNTSKKGYFIDLLIQGATLPVYISILFALIYLEGYLNAPWNVLAIIYFLIIIIIAALFVPIAYQLTFKQSTNETRDPVNKIRTKTFLFELTGFMLGLPGFFAILLLVTLIVPNYVQYFFTTFLLIMTLKVCARFLITIRSFKK